MTKDRKVDGRGRREDDGNGYEERRYCVAREQTSPTSTKENSRKRERERETFRYCRDRRDSRKTKREIPQGTEEESVACNLIATRIRRNELNTVGFVDTFLTLVDHIEIRL